MDLQTVLKEFPIGSAVQTKLPNGPPMLVNSYDYDVDDNGEAAASVDVYAIECLWWTDGIRLNRDSFAPETLLMRADRR